MRGNRQHLFQRHVDQGSIPADAGEPHFGQYRRMGNWVYPRGCGGTPGFFLTYEPGEGLSPRMRGNRRAIRGAIADTGSIPADAGEPCPGRVALGRPGVYPRGCGGTRPPTAAARASSGLSPRMRGNRRIHILDRTKNGSIPADAGEPRLPSRLPPRCWVYPRGCGGTVVRKTSLKSEPGLSPRMRGNPVIKAAHSVIGGSIPADAGEPSSASLASALARVYPRGCGGTSRVMADGAGMSGLSPRMRGNQPDRPNGSGRSGSIPADAGEPATAIDLRRCQKVYPRGCGGTTSA